MKSLVILGAAYGSMATYRTARALGYRTIAVDLRVTAPGVALADEYLPISTREPDLIAAALAGRDDLVGVLAPCSDIALPTQQTLAGRFGLLCGLTDATIRASVDKAFFRALCHEQGLPTYRWVAGDDAAELASQGRHMRFPVVVKPADAQSGRGVTRCADPAAVDLAVLVALEHSYGGTVIIEEEVPGLHCGCECVIEDGRVAFLALTERLLTPPPLALTTGHILPARLPPLVYERAVTIVNSLVTRLGYRRGPLNLDIVVDPTGVPYLIEMGARTGGDPLGELVGMCHGVDPIAASINAAVGTPDGAAVLSVRPRTARPVMAQILGADRFGELVAITGLPEARAMPEVRDIVLLAGPGSQVRSAAGMAGTLGYAILAGSSGAGLRRAAKLLLRTIQFEVHDSVRESA